MMEYQEQDYSDWYRPEWGWTLEEFNEILNIGACFECFVKYGMPLKPKEKDM